MQRMLPHIAKIVPRQRFAKLSGNFRFFRKLLLCHARPRHHFAYQLFHINNRRDKICPVNKRFSRCTHGKICPYAVCHKHKTAAALALPGKKPQKFLLCLPRCLRPVIKPHNLRIRKQRPIMLRLLRRAAFAVNIYNNIFHNYFFAPFMPVSAFSPFPALPRGVPGPYRYRHKGQSL